MGYRLQIKVENGIRPAMEVPFARQVEAVRRAQDIQRVFPDARLDIRVFDGENRQVWPDDRLTVA